MAPSLRPNRLIALVTALLLLAAAFPFTAAQAAPSATIVISQVYGGGGATASVPTYYYDYVELFNRGAEPQNIQNWSLQYASYSGSSWSKVSLPDVTIQPGRYYLVRLGGTVQDPSDTDRLLNEADYHAGVLNMAATRGKIALVRNSDLVKNPDNTNPLNPTVDPDTVDFVGYGGANAYEGSTTPQISTTTALLRLNGGCTETDNNGLDFAVQTPAPRNSSTPVHSCSGDPDPIDSAPTVQSTSPANNAVDVAPDAAIAITFSEPVDLGDGWFTLTCADEQPPASATGAGDSYTILPGGSLPFGALCTVTVIAAEVTDQDEPVAAMENDYSFRFTVESAPVLIGAIQGPGHLSPLDGQGVSNVRGVVTALKSNGFYMQDPNPAGDGDPLTSDSIFVFTSNKAKPAVGDLVKVSGLVDEYRSASGNLSLTEIVNPVFTVLAQNQPLYAVAPMPPTAVIDNDANGDVETTGLFDPDEDGIDYWETLESAYVTVPDAMVIGRRTRFGETWVMANGGANATGLNSRLGLTISATDSNPERIMIDDELLKYLGLGTIPPVSVGDTFTGPLYGVVDYAYSSWKVQLTEAVTLLPADQEREVTAEARPEQLTIATFNVENLNATASQAKFDELVALIVNNLLSPDILVLEEIQDNDGPASEGNADASATYARLIAAIASAGGPTYDYRQVDPEPGMDGGQPGGNIRVAFLFRTDRAITFIDRPGAGPTTANAVVSGGAGSELRYSPGRIDPTNSAFEDSRKALAGEFLYNNQKLFLVANHFNSKGGDGAPWGRFQPPVRSTEIQRHAQAQVVSAFVQQILDADPNANVVVLGDLNDFQFSETLTILKSAGLHNPMELLDETEQFNYVFDGNHQALDHVLVSTNLLQNVGLEYDIVHVNAGYAEQASDHDPQLIRLTLPAVTDRSANGGGSFSFQPGAYQPDPTLGGKASTGFSLQLGDELKGQLQFSIDGLIDFHAANFDWATFSDTGVEFEGTGIAEGLGALRFRADAFMAGKKGKDSFRIILWSEETGEVLFDSGTQALNGSLQVR